MWPQRELYWLRHQTNSSMTRANIRTGHRSQAHVPCAVDVLSQATADAGALQQLRHHRRTTVPRRAAPAGTVAFAGGWLGQAGLMSHRPAAVPAPRSSFAGFRFPPEVIILAVRWYLRYDHSRSTPPG